MKDIVYISGKISGTSDYMERFQKAEDLLISKGYRVINPAKVMCPLDGTLDYEQMMELDFRLIDWAHTIFMMHGWQQSCGANRELGYALGTSKDVMYEDELY